MKTSGEKLRDLREAYGLSQREFGEKLGITRASVNAYERNDHPLPKKVKIKVSEIIGIGFEYFDTEMSLDEAFEKFGVDLKDELESKNTSTSICLFYEGMRNFVEGKSYDKPLEISSPIIKYLFDSDYAKLNLCFIKLNSDEFEPFANYYDILVAVRDKKVTNNDKIIIEFNGNTKIVKYFRTFSTNEIELTINDEKLTFKEDEFKQSVKILGIVLEVFRTFPLRDRYLYK